MLAVRQRRVSRVQSIPAPYGGINEIEPLAAMGSKYAIALDNLFPDNLTLRSRPGYIVWAENVPSSIKTLVNYSKTDGTEELFAATDDGLYDVSSSTDAPVKVADLSRGYVIFTHFSNIAGNYLVVCNGTDPALLYDGTTWIPFTVGVDPWGPGVIGGGLAPESISYVLAYKNRLWFIQRASLTAWYLPVDAVGGEAKPFLLGSIYNRGGTLIQMFTWSLDSGEGLDDKIVFHTTQGELAIYSGDDPDVTESWALDSVYYSSAPIGPKASEDYGGDVLMLCRNGLLPLSSVVKGNFQVDEEEIALSKRISRSFVSLVNSIYFTPNWELHNVPSLRSVCVIIPKSDTFPAIQYVMNSNTNAWCRYLIEDVNCGRQFRNQFFWADSKGRVLRFSGALDNVNRDGTGGEAIRARMTTSFNYFDDPTTNKHFKMVRPIFQSKSVPTAYYRVLVDYSQNVLLTWPLPSEAGLTGSKWDQAKWNVDYWEASVLDAYHLWLSVYGLGFCAALNMNVTLTDQLNMTAVEWVYETGGAI